MKNNKLNFVLNALAILIILLGIIYALLVMLKWDDEQKEVAGYLENYNGSFLSPLFWITYISIGLAIVAAFIMPLFYLIKNPKELIKLVAGIGVFVILCLLSYGVADSSIPENFSAGDAAEITPGTSKFVGGGLIAFYIFLGLAILTIVFSEVKGALKK